MKILLYILGFWGGWAVGVLVGVALLGGQANFSILLGLIGSGVGIWCVRKTQGGESRSQADLPTPPPQTVYTDNRTIDNRRVYHIVASDKGEAEQIIRQVEQDEEPATARIDTVRRKLLEMKE